MPVLNEIFEKIIFMKIYPQVHNLITVQQHGFTKGRTVETNLMEFNHHIAETLDKKPQTQIDVDLDFEKHSIK